MIDGDAHGSVVLLDGFLPGVAARHHWNTAGFHGERIYRKRLKHNVRLTPIHWKHNARSASINAH